MSSAMLRRRHDEHRRGSAARNRLADLVISNTPSACDDGYGDDDAGKDEDDLRHISGPDRAAAGRGARSARQASAKSSGGLSESDTRQGTRSSSGMDVGDTGLFSGPTSPTAVVVSVSPTPAADGADALRLAERPSERHMVAADSPAADAAAEPAAGVGEAAGSTRAGRVPLRSLGNVAPAATDGAGSPTAAATASAVYEQQPSPPAGEGPALPRMQNAVAHVAEAGGGAAAAAAAAAEAGGSAAAAAAAAAGAASGSGIGPPLLPSQARLTSGSEAGQAAVAATTASVTISNDDALEGGALGANSSSSARATLTSSNVGAVAISRSGSLQLPPPPSQPQPQSLMGSAADEDAPALPSPSYVVMTASVSRQSPVAQQQQQEQPHGDVLPPVGGVDADCGTLSPPRQSRSNSAVSRSLSHSASGRHTTSVSQQHAAQLAQPPGQAYRRVLGSRSVSSGGNTRSAFDPSMSMRRVLRVASTLGTGLRTLTAGGRSSSRHSSALVHMDQATKVGENADGVRAGWGVGAQG